MAEHNFQFRRRLNMVHLPNRRDPELQPRGNETAVDDGWRIVIAPKASEYMIRLAQDLQDYLFTSMNVSVLLTRDDNPAGEKTIFLTTADTSPEYGKELSVRRSYRLIVQPNSIIVCGHDEWGTGQGCYYLEDIMNLREAPFVEQVNIARAPVFSPRMIHSGWGIDQFPDTQLNAIAHAGMDAVLVFVKGPDMTTTGYLDINNLIDRAELFGLDVYLYSYLKSEKHPDDPEAEEFYEGTYGALMRSCPRAKGIIFVGESCEFPSKDPNTTGKLRLDPTLDRTKDKRPSPGWWPCTDYPQWLDMLKRILRKYNPDLDVVFWTYNWGWAPEENRIALIHSLPTDISLQATFEMFEDVPKEGIITRCVDYTTSFAGPGKYFLSEARAAHERGIPLYTMSNTAGMSWDIGVIPYQPIPFQWARRYRALLEAREKYGLVGLMESHHYGWWPSFVNELAKWAYWEPTVSTEEMADHIARREFGPAGAPAAVEAWQAWSEAWRDYVPTNEDQYGPFRVGPAYPLMLFAELPPFPSASYAHFGARIMTMNYTPHKPEDLDTEIFLLERMRSRWEEGLARLEEAVALTPERKRPTAETMLRLGRFIRNCVQTTINTKRWWQLKTRLRDAASVEEKQEIAAQLKQLGEAEIANAEETIPMVEEDSRLGWEPSMEYMCDREHIEWKIARLREVLDEELPKAVKA